MVKVFMFRGKSLEELQKMNLDVFAKLISSRERRHLTRGFTESEKKFLEKIRKSDKPTRTQCREMVIIPEMIGKKIMIHNGKEWIIKDITIEMLGHRLGEFSLTRAKVSHSSPGVGATKSSKFLPLK